MSANSLPADAIQRVLYLHPKVHIFAVPPQTSATKGPTAAAWTVNPPIFTARLRLIETAIPVPSQPHHPPTSPPVGRPIPPNPTSIVPQTETVTTSILLEDPKTGELFAEAPYAHPSAVQPCSDSARFFAVRVVGDGGRKAVLGMGFEERGDSFDFGVALQEAGKVLGFGGGEASASGKAGLKGGKKKEEEVKRDYSLKEGETIVVNVGKRAARARTNGTEDSEAEWDTGNAGPADRLFEIKPPPPSADGQGPLLPPPPSADALKKGMNREPTAEELGFDDGEFGEFQ